MPFSISPLNGRSPPRPSPAEQAADPDLAAAAHGAGVTTPAGMMLDGAQDTIQVPPTSDPTADPDGDGVANEVPTSLVDHMEFYLLNYFKPGEGELTPGALVLFPPDDTASNLSPGDRGAAPFPQFGHGSLKLTVLFNDPTDIE